MITKTVILALSAVLVFGIGLAMAAGADDNGPEFENEVEMEHGIEAEHCPGGGQIFLGTASITPPSAGATMSGLTANLRHQDCVAEVENVEVEKKKINEDVHVKGEFEFRPDNKLEIKDMTIVHDNNKVTSAAGDDFTVTCTKTIPAGTFDGATGTLVGTVTVTCTATGTMKKKADDLFLELLPHQ
ncbi:MAG TPA: hypothetical protein VN260_08695 [Dissulfurispiraceae bacterium]|nr:hypothetical protein [Dissulfurispiraceae bacterium]